MTDERLEEYMQGISLTNGETDLSKYFPEVSNLCRTYLELRGNEAKKEEWVCYFEIMSGVIRNRWDAHNWKRGLFHILEKYFSEVIGNGGPKTKEGIDFVRRREGGWLI